MAWWSRKPRNLISIGDPALAALFQVGNPNYTGIAVGQDTALGIAAFWRAVSLVSGTIAELPLNTVRESAGIRTKTASFLDDPGGVVGLTPFEWKQLLIVYQMLHGASPLAHVRNGAGTLAGLVPFHPLSVTIDPIERTDDVTAPFARTYSVTLTDGSRKTFTEGLDMTYCPGMSVDGVRGLSLISVARNSLGTAIAGDRAAAKLFADGALMSGMVTPEDGELVDGDDAKAIKADLDQRVAGWENAGQIAVINRRLKFQPWTIPAEDMQFIQSRQFQIEEIARWTGVPPHLLMQTEKQTSWGTGVAEQNRGLSRFTLAPWTTRLEQRLSRLLPRGTFCEFDFAGLERPTPEQEVDSLIKLTGAGIMTVDEARKVRNLPPLGDGAELTTSPSGAPAEPVPA